MKKNRIAVIALAIAISLAAGCDSFENKPVDSSSQETANEAAGDVHESMGEIPVSANVSGDNDVEEAPPEPAMESDKSDTEYTEYGGDEVEGSEDSGGEATDLEESGDEAEDSGGEVTDLEESGDEASESGEGEVVESGGDEASENSGGEVVEATDAPEDSISGNEVVENTDSNSTPVSNPVDANNLPAAENVVSPFSNVSFGSPYLADGSLSNKKYGWYTNRNNNHQPTAPPYKDFDVLQLGGYYLGDYSNKTVYLTFDEGYEAGYTERILDVLKDKNVKAAFFVTKPYIKSNVELCKRMIEEGHLVSNHSVSHLSMPDLDDDKVRYELEETERYFQEMTGYTMSKHFRPPMGEYSARTLKLVSDMGIKSVFWSFAHRDYFVDDQPSKAETYKLVMDNIHNGSIMLLHAVSSSNTEALPDIIDSILELGYEFRTLDDLK